MRYIPVITYFYYIIFVYAITRKRVAWPRTLPIGRGGGYLFLELIIIIANIANNKIKLNIINNIAPLVYKL